MLEGSVVNIYITGTVNHLHLHLPDDTTKLEQNVTAQFDAIMRAIQEENTVVDSLVTLVDQLNSNNLTPDEQAQLIAEIGNKKQQLADSVLRNTRAATVEASTPTPEPGTVAGTTTGNNEGGATTPTTEPAPTTETTPPTTEPAPATEGTPPGGETFPNAPGGTTTP